jgi:hypothetical protein
MRYPVQPCCSGRTLLVGLAAYGRRPANQHRERFDRGNNERAVLALDVSVKSRATGGL